MILPDNEINKRISNGKLLVNEDESTISSPTAQNISYDLSTKKFYSKEQDSKEGTDTFELRPLDSVFVASLERINLPNDVIAEVKLKYSLMTDGLMLDAPLYQPGHNGSNIFFRLTNISNKDIELEREKKYAYIVFHQVAGNVEKPYNGKFCDPQTSINEIREHSYRGVYPDIMDDINRTHVKINNTEKKINNTEKTIYGNVLVIMTIFITLFSLLSSFFNMEGDNLFQQYSTAFLILGSIFALVGAVCIAIDNDKSFKSKIIVLWVAAFIFFILPFASMKVKAHVENQTTNSSQSQDLYESPCDTTERDNLG